MVQQTELENDFGENAQKQLVRFVKFVEFEGSQKGFPVLL